MNSLKIKTSELTLVPELSRYNYNIFSLESPQEGITHIVETYTGGSHCPDYQLGIVVNGFFETLLAGGGNGIPMDYISNPVTLEIYIDE